MTSSVARSKGGWGFGGVWSDFKNTITTTFESPSALPPTERWSPRRSCPHQGFLELGQDVTVLVKKGLSGSM